jgi:mannose-6-phosphate isomerase-like protein (cupin superfamily)
MKESSEMPHGSQDERLIVADEMVVMRVLKSDSARLTPEFGIMVGRWSQYADAGAAPFGAMWCVVPPGGQTDTDCHPDTELVVVVRGSADVQGGGHTETALPGTAVLLESEEPHVLVNRSTDEPLVTLSVYWVPEEAAVGAGHADAG